MCWVSGSIDVTDSNKPVYNVHIKLSHSWLDILYAHRSHNWLKDYKYMKLEKNEWHAICHKKGEVCNVELQLAPVINIHMPCSHSDILN